jgi:hypothetical protein
VSRSTYLSYGSVSHSPAQYNVPGRAIIDESDTFFYGETNLDGVYVPVSSTEFPVRAPAVSQRKNKAFNVPKRIPISSKDLVRVDGTLGRC